MSRTYKDSPERRQARTRGGRTRPRNIAVHGVRRDPPDLHKLSRALIALVLAEAEEEAEVAASHATNNPTTSKPADQAPTDAESSDQESPDGR